MFTITEVCSITYDVAGRFTGGLQEADSSRRRGGTAAWVLGEGAHEPVQPDMESVQPTPVSASGLRRPFLPR